MALVHVHAPGLVHPAFSRPTTHHAADAARTPPAISEGELPPKAPSSRDFGALPLAFEANHGQTNARVNFITHAGGATVFLAPTGAVFRMDMPLQAHDHSSFGIPADMDVMFDTMLKPSKSSLAVTMQLVGGNPDAVPIGQDQLPGIVNYFIGNDPSRWHTKIPTFGRVGYQDVYPGIDQVYYGENGQLEYDFIVAPGAESSTIALEFSGANGLEIGPLGDLVIHTSAGDQVHQKPFSYQQVGDTIQEVPSQFTLNGATVGFEVGNYDMTLPLVIDPAVVLGYSTFFGGAGTDIGAAIVADRDGNVYVAGGTKSTDFPTHDPFQGQLGGSNSNVYVSKLTPDGSTVVYSTYLGGSGTGLDGEVARAAAVDSDGNVYLTGSVFSSDFPTANAFQPNLAGARDTFLAKLSADGSELLYSTYLGGSTDDFGYGVDLDRTNHAYVTGGTYSDDFPTTAGSFQPNSGGVRDVFVTKFAADGMQLDYSTYLGGSDLDYSNGIEVDAFGRATIAGEARSANFPTLNALDSTYNGNTDVIIARLNRAGTGLTFSTFIGGAEEDNGFSVSLDSTGNIFFVARTFSSNFPMVNAIQTENQGGFGENAVGKLSPDGSTLLFSTYFGGTGGEFPSHLDNDAAGNVYISGLTSSVDFPLINNWQHSYGGGPADPFVFGLTADGSDILLSSWHGGRNIDHAHCLDVDDFGNVWVTGHTDSHLDFPTFNAIQAAPAGGHEAWIGKILERF